jgi:integrase
MTTSPYPNRGHVRQTSTGWIADVYIEGRRRQLKAKTKAEAQARMAEALAGRLGPSGGRSSGQFTLKEAVALSERVRWSKNSNWQSTLCLAAQVVAYLGPNTPLAEVGPEQVEAMREHFAQQGNRPSTINAKVSCLKVMRSDAQFHGKVEALKPMPKALKILNHKDQTFTAAEVNSICAYMRQACNHQAADLFVFLVETGCRFSEAQKLTATDVGITNRTVCFSKTKANRPRSIPLTLRAIEALQPNMPPTHKGRIWTITYRQMQRIYNDAKLALRLDPGLTLHNARHTCLTRLAQKGISLPQLQAWGGHSQLSNLQRYIHIQTDRLMECVEALDTY